jgi:tetratricopeptide (TPR) repeat protein
MAFAADVPKAVAPWKAVADEATAARQANRLDEAVRLYEKALRLNPKWEEGWWFLATIHYEQDRYRECRDAFVRFTGLNKKAGPAFVMLGLCEFQLGQLGDALRHIRAGEELGMPEGSQLVRVAYFHEALLMIKLENYERALYLLSLLLKDGQEDPAAIAAMGIAGLRRPLLPKEVPEADRELAMRLGQAVTLGFQRRPVEARKAFDQVLAENPTVPSLHYTYGSFLLGQDADAAIREWKKELEISPDHLPSLVSLSIEYLNRGDAAAARPFAERAIKAAPEHFTSQAAMGRVLLESGDHVGAIPYLEKAAKTAPDSPQIRLALAAAYRRSGRKADAAREQEAFASLKEKKAATQQ